MRLREAYCFDEHTVHMDGVQQVNLLAVSDKRTFYVKAGATDGVRFLLHMSEEGRWYTADRLHAGCLWEVKAELAVAALKKAADCCQASLLLPMQEVPGFRDKKHVQGWFSRGEFALPLDPPSWAPGAKVFDIKEGIYLVFPPEDAQGDTFRLMRRKEYYRFSSLPSSLLGENSVRQGDCFAAWCEPERLLSEAVDTLAGMRTRIIQDGEGGELERHRIEAGTWVLKHPEHPDQSLPNPPEGGDYKIALFLLPGTSRPFKRAYGD